MEISNTHSDETLTHTFSVRAQFPWYALKVRAGGEARVNFALDQRGYEVFLPTFVDCRRYSDRMKKVEASLFPGYLFCRIDLLHRLPVLTTPGVESIVGIAGVPKPIEAMEIAAIEAATRSGAPAMPWPYLSADHEVEIQFGSLAGIRGLVVKSSGADRLVLSIHLLQRSISVEIDRTWVRPVHAQTTRCSSGHELPRELRAIS